MKHVLLALVLTIGFFIIFVIELIKALWSFEFDAVKELLTSYIIEMVSIYEIVTSKFSGK